LSSRLNIFYYRMKDIIQFVPISTAPLAPRMAENSGEQTGKGFEWEIKWDINSAVSLSGNYALQHSEDKLTNSDVPNTPEQQFYSKLNWKVFQNLRATTQLNWVADRKRAVGDVRPDIDDYTTVDFILRYTLKNDWEISVNSKNIFDADVREPSPGGTSLAGIPNDLPMAGRSIYMELRLQL